MNIVEGKFEMRRLKDTGNTYSNLPVSGLIEMALIRREGTLTSSGALQVVTGKYTGRSPKDRYIVQEPGVENTIDWGPVNRPMSSVQFGKLFEKAEQYMQKQSLFIFDGMAGADPEHQMKFRVVTEYAWHNLFMHQLLIRPTEEELAAYQSDFTIVNLPGLQADPERDGTNSEAVIAISFERRMVLICGTQYAGEMKKSVFSILNYLLPLKGLFPMHCSANVGEAGDAALFFGLSGTGKTTLSADPDRRLTGDDEHVWSEKGIFNIEGGCYAKCIGLTAEKEPQIWNAIKYGSVLENVVIDSATGVPDFDNRQITENTRAAYPIDYIPNAVIPGTAGHPQTIIFLTADAFGVLPPISRLTKEQAMYHFLSGYTSKLAGTERGVTEPEATFSACFGSPFLPLSPTVYAELLNKKISQHGANVYLINTGWTGGPYGTGNRINLNYTRAMVTAALEGVLEHVTYTKESFFGLDCPDRVPGVPSEVLMPINTWPDKQGYARKAAELAHLFTTNFRNFPNAADEIKKAGPPLNIID